MELLDDCKMVINASIPEILLNAQYFIHFFNSGKQFNKSIKILWLLQHLCKDMLLIILLLLKLLFCQLVIVKDS